MLSSVAILAYEGVSTFGLGVAAEVFGCDRSGEGLPRYDYAVTAAHPGLIRTDVGMRVLVEAGLDRLSSADLAVVVCWDDPDTRPPEPVLRALRTVVSRGGRVSMSSQQTTTARSARLSRSSPASTRTGMPTSVRIRPGRAAVTA